MKLICLLALFLLICNNYCIKSYSQTLQKTAEVPAAPTEYSDKSLQEDELPTNIPANSVVLQELLNDNKQQVIDIRAKMHHIEEYSGFLQMSKNNLSEVEGTKIEAICKHMVANIGKGNVESSIELRSLRDKVEPMLSIARSVANIAYSFDSGEQVISQDFAAKIARAVAPLKNNEIAELFSNEIDNGKSFTLNNDIINLFLNTFTAANINGIKDNLMQIMQGEIDAAKQKIVTSNKEILKLGKIRKDLLSKQVEEKNINSLAITLGLPLFCGTILCLFIIPIIINKGANTTPASQNVIVEISTVLLLTMSILILGLATKIASDVLGTLIGGISGYVLNRIRVSASGKQEPNE